MLIAAKIPCAYAVPPMSQPVLIGSGVAQRGQGMVEFALVAPVFFLFLALVIQGALYINAQATIDNATREGVRAATVCGSGGTGATAQSCHAAALAAVRANLGILDPGAPLSVRICAADTSTGANCSAPYQAASYGTVVEVDSTYTYRYYLDPLFGTGGPSVTITSRGRGVSQQ